MVCVDSIISFDRFRALSCQKSCGVAIHVICALNQEPGDVEGSAMIFPLSLWQR